MTKAERERAVGSERDRAIAEAVLRSPRVRIPCALCEAACFTDPGCGEPYCGVDLDAIIAAVDAQHPAPALPREVLTRVAEEAVESVSRFEAREVSDTIDAIVSRHLPTDEEREAADAVVEAALAEHEAWEAIADSDEWEMPAKGVGAAAARSREACLRLLAIRAKRGAR